MGFPYLLYSGELFLICHNEGWHKEQMGEAEAVALCLPHYWGGGGYREWTVMNRRIDCRVLLFVVN